MPLAKLPEGQNCDILHPTEKRYIASLFKTQTRYMASLLKTDERA